MKEDGTILKCQNCQEELEADWETCPACKTPTSRIKEKLQCPNCHYIIKKHWKECPKCHTELSGWATPPENSTNKNKKDFSSGQIFLSGPIDNDIFAIKITIPDNEVIGEKFIIQKKLGQGGYGSVYLAQDTVLNEQVALKIVILGKGKNEKAAEQLIHEFKLREKVNDSTHIIKAYDPRSCEYKNLSLVLLPMEFAKDGNLRTWLRKHSNQKTQLNKALEFFKQTCLGIKAIHDVGLSHLDIKPENILLINNIAKITDFGIGRYIDNQQCTNPMQLMNQGIGTPQYMSPEQFKVARQKEVGHSSDIYTLGLLLYEILDGNLPFDGSPEDLKEKHLTLSPPILKGYNDLWWKIISKCLNKNPIDRYHSISLLINDIERVSKGLPLSADVSCPKCNNINKNINVKFCEKCGHELKDFFYPCLVCAKEVRIDIEYCPGCNAPIKEQYLYLSHKKQIDILKDEEPTEAIELLEIVLRSNGGGTEDELILIKELRNKSQTISLIITEANKFDSAGEIEKAIDCWCKVLTFFPRHRVALKQLETLEKQLKDFFQLKNKAIDCMDEGNFEEAETSLQNCMRLIPSRKEINNLLNELNQRSHKYYLFLNQAQSAMKSKRLFEAKKLLNDAKNYAPKSKAIFCIEQDIPKKITTAENLLNTAKTKVDESKFQEVDKLILKIKNIIIDHPEAEKFRTDYKKIEIHYKEKVHYAKQSKKSGNLEDACNSLNSAKELCSNSYEVKELINTIYEIQNEVHSFLKNVAACFKSAEFDLAEEYLTKAEHLWSTFQEIQLVRNQYLQIKNDYLHHIQKASEDQNSGNLNEALTKLELAKKLCPNSPQVNELIKTISELRQKIFSFLTKAEEYFQAAEFHLSDNFIKEAESLCPAFSETQRLKAKYLRDREEYHQIMQEAKNAQIDCNFKVVFLCIEKAKKLCPNSKEICTFLLQIQNQKKRISKYLILTLGVLLLAGGSIYYSTYLRLQEERKQKELYQQVQLIRKKAEEERQKQEEVKLKKQHEEELAYQKKMEKQEEMKLKKAKLEKEIKKDLDACYNMLIQGNGEYNYIKSSYKQKLSLWQEATKFNLPAGEYLLGKCYQMGFGVKKDYAESIKWYRKAAAQGHGLAQTNLGFCYLTGHGVQQNYTEAVKWFKKAAEQEIFLAQFNLGVCYDKGRGVQQNYTQAVKWYEKAANQGYEAAQFNLGFCYSSGRGVKQNYTEATKWFKKSAEQGNIESQYNLGVSYENGWGVSKNYYKAAKWYQKAAENGHVYAQHNLAVLYYNGTGVSQNYTESAKWHKKAAKNGHAGAQFKLGIYYYKGIGVSKNYNVAMKWIKKAAKQGNKDAINFLEK